MYVLKLTSEAIANIKALPKGIKNSLRRALEDDVARDPEGCSKPLTGPLEGFRSYHWEGYRVVFQVFPDLRAVAIVRVGERRPGHNTDIYRRLEEVANSGRLAEIVLSNFREIARPRS